jgi:hypothetical protein
MATTNLSQNRATQRLLKHRLAVATLARQAAVKAVKRQLQAQGIKVHSLSAKDIRALADDYLGQHRERLVAEAKQIVATSPLFERCRWPVANIASDAALAKALAELGNGDTLVVCKLDRLARSTRDLLNTLAAIADAGASFKSLGDQWADTTTPHGRLMLTVLGGLAEFERHLILARTSEGRQRAQQRGVRFGRRPKLTAHQQQEALARRLRVKPWLTSPDPMQSRTQHLTSLAIKWARLRSEGPPVWPFTTTGRPHPVMATASRIRQGAEFLRGAARWTSERTTRDSRSCRPCS